MTRVTTFSAQQSALLNLQRAQSREATYGAQVSSGRQGDDLKAYGAGARGIAALKTVSARIAGWSEQGAFAQGRLETQDLMLGRVAEAAGEARRAVLDGLSLETSLGLMDKLEAAFGKAAQALNAQHDGRPLFGGASSETPFAARTLADLTAAPDAAALFRNDQVRAAVRLGETTVVETGVLADEAGAPLAAAYRELQAFVEADGGFSTPLTEPQKAALRTFADQLAAAESGVTTLTARNGLVSKQVETELESLSARAISLENLLGARTDVDPAEAVTKLQQAQLVVQASAQVFASLRGSTLVDLLT
jgi:flagellar hook-associated protein 3 FlgL